MSAKIIDGKRIAEQVEGEVLREVQEMARSGLTPGLVVVRVGDDPASEVYVRSKERKARELGIQGRQLHLPTDTSEDALLAEIRSLNADVQVDGILVQLPLPRQIDTKRILDAVDPEKDVDGFHPVNVGKLHAGRPSLVPCTPAGVMRMLDAIGFDPSGKRAVVVGRSDIVGKPVAALLLHRHATVTIAHSRTPDLGAVVREADLVVAATGKPMLIVREMLKPGAVVIDVGINRVDRDHPAYAQLSARKKEIVEKKGSTLVGDVDFEGASEVASWITPVPGGVGPMTIAMLLENTVRAARERRR